MLSFETEASSFKHRAFEQTEYEENSQSESESERADAELMKKKHTEYVGVSWHIGEHMKFLISFL